MRSCCSLVVNRNIHTDICSIYKHRSNQRETSDQDLLLCQSWSLKKEKTKKKKNIWVTVFTLEAAVYFLFPVTCVSLTSASISGVRVRSLGNNQQLIFHQEILIRRQSLHWYFDSKWTFNILNKSCISLGFEFCDGWMGEAEEQTQPESCWWWWWLHLQESWELTDASGGINNLSFTFSFWGVMTSKTKCYVSKP